MARIAGVDLPNKHVNIALTYVFGIGHSSADEICAKTKIDPHRLINELSQEELNELRQLIESDYKVAGRFLLTGHLSLLQRSPLSMSFFCSARHKRQTGPVYLAMVT
ncbi:hypothetical protein FACS1894124_7800 [Spirochaetia bacterium]|nr:hypothetical protein FACS1894124_7800 [Spirochaetia bacterium]